MADGDDEKVELAPVPSNERESVSKNKNDGNKNKNNNNDEVVVIAMGDDPNNRGFSLPSLSCDCSCCRDLSCSSLLDRSNDLNLISIFTYLVFYGIYLFHFIVFITFVGDTAWFDAEYCKESSSKDECTDQDENGFLCVWSTFKNANEVKTYYCDSSPAFTVYQIGLLLYFILYLLGWEVLSMLGSIKSIASLDRISKQPPSRQMAREIATRGRMESQPGMTPGGPTPGGPTRGGKTPMGGFDDSLASGSDAYGMRFGANFVSPGGPDDEDMFFMSPGGNSPGGAVDEEFVTPGLAGGMDMDDYDWYFGGADEEEERCGANSYRFRNRYIWAYNVFLPVKWIVLIAVSRFRKFESFKYSLVASLSLDRINLMLELGLKCVLNLVFAAWWAAMNNEVDGVTQNMFIASGLVLIQCAYELLVLRAYSTNIYVLGAK